jgi:DNA helicase-2/ATP-dependent DNA helicase PcrA
VQRPSERDPDSLAGPARRPGLTADKLLAGLNPQQRRAIKHAGSPLLIAAGAGSGKTRVLTHRIGYLLAARGAKPGEILAITFDAGPGAHICRCAPVLTSI